jgi:hypothetical protein
MNTKILSLTVKWPFSWYFIFKNKDKVPSLIVTWYITGLPSGTSLRPYRSNFAECNMIFKCNFNLYTPQWDFNEFRIIAHGTLSQWPRGFLLVTHGTLIEFFYIALCIL